jgi:hypothetical protein
MDRTTVPTPSLRNELTHRRHRHEVTWQILAPLGAGVFLVLVLAALSAFATTIGEKSQLADVALISLILQALFFGVITLLMLAATVYGLFRLLPLMPTFFFNVQNFFWKIQINVVQIDSKLTEPFLRIHSFTASTRAFGGSLRRAVRRK